MCSVGIIVENKEIQTLHLHGNEFANTRDEINFAIEASRGNTSLKELGWSHNAINSVEDARYLFQVFNSIEGIVLVDCWGEGMNGYDILCALLECNRNLIFITLDNNNIQSMGRTHLPDFLATNPPLTSLSLMNNMLSDNDAILVASSLRRNTTLRCLNMLGNEFTEMGEKSLHTAVFDQSSLNAVADANQRCFIVGVVSEGDIADNNLGRPCENRARKIYQVLSAQHEERSNNRHLELEFGDDSVKFAPKVLECVCVYSKKVYSKKVTQKKSYKMVNTLSITYEIFREWRLPD